MPNPVGQGILTIQGASAIADAASKGVLIQPKYYKASRDDIPLDTTLTDLTGVWRQADISGYVKIDEQRVQFWVDIPPEEANDYTRTVGLYLADGTLFAVGKPPFPFPPSARQSLFIQLQLNLYGVDEVFDFKYIPFYETEQYLSLLNTTFSLGESILTLRQDIELLKQARKVLFENDSKLRQDIQELKQRTATLEQNQLALLGSFYTLAQILLKHSQEIQRLKGGV